jgi:hypothetical protein
MISPHVFTGGDLATNGYVLEGSGGAICFDAPEGMARELMRCGIKPVALILTHGHFDHMWDAALIQEDHQCPVYIHPADAPMVLDTSYVKMFGVATPPRSPAGVESLEIPDQGSVGFACAGEDFQLFHLPGRRHPSSRLGRAHQRRHALLRRRGPLGPPRRFPQCAAPGPAQAPRAAPPGNPRLRRPRPQHHHRP